MHSPPLPKRTDSAPHLRVVGLDDSSNDAESWSFDDVYRRYAPYVATIGLRILASRDEADDLVQEVFLSAHRHLSDLREPEKVKGWLSTIAVRKAISRLRRRRLRRLLPIDETPDYDFLADPSATPEQRVEIAKVYQALESMPAAERTVWVLRHVEGHTLEQVVEYSKLSLSTVQRKLRKVESRLKRRALDV